MRYISLNKLQTRDLGKKTGADLYGGEVFCLYGDLGAGKTVFASGLINFFLPKKRVLSPTFIIVRHYEPDHPLIKFIYHVDLYRLFSSREIIDTGIMNLMHKKDTVVIIEWAQKLKGLLPRERIEVRFEIKDEAKRIMEIQNYG